MFLRLFFAALWSPAGKWPTSWPLFVLFNCSFVFVMLSRLFIAALWSSAEKGLTSWFLFVLFNCIFVFFDVVSWRRCGT